MASWIWIALWMLFVPGQQTWTGKISDSACGAHHEQGEGVEPMNDADCTLACIRGGSKFVLVTEESIYPIANQDDPNLPKHAGLKVKVTGELKSSTITVSRIDKIGS